MPLSRHSLLRSCPKRWNVQPSVASNPTPGVATWKVGNGKMIMLGKDYFQGNMIKHSISVHEVLQNDASFICRTPTSLPCVICGMLNSQRSRQNMVSWRRLFLIASNVFVWTEHHRHYHHYHRQKSTAAFTSRVSACLTSSPRFFRPTKIIPNLRHMTKHIHNEGPTTWCFFSIYPCATKQWRDLRFRMPWHSAGMARFVGFFLARVPNPDQLGWNASRCPQPNEIGKSGANESMFTEGSCPETRPMRFANSLLVHTHWLLRWMTRRHPKLPQESNLGGLQNIWKFGLKDRSMIHWSILLVNLFRISFEYL